MPRRPAVSPPPSLPSRIASTPLLDIELGVITPLFGGGSETRTVDSDMPVRGSAIRGQLRFWWRACHVARFATPADLFREESRIWGAATGGVAGPSEVDVRVDMVERGSPAESPATRNHLYPSYATFPFEDAKTLPPPPGRTRGPRLVTIAPEAARQNVRFRLIVTAAAHIRDAGRHEELAQGVEDAVWAWVMFGGVGARTRRGCGALVCLGDDARFLPGHNVEEWLKQTVRQHVAAGQRRLPVPSLTGARLWIGQGQPSEPVRAWDGAMRPMREFRQGEKIGRKERNPGTKSPGRSFWPEPDSVRERLPQLDTRHRAEHAAKPYYPRADLGLPILFQNMGRGTPTLQGSEDRRQRMASPIILKPLALGPQRAVPLAVLLNAPHVWEGPGVELKPGDRSRPEPIPTEELYRVGQPISPAHAQRLPHLGRDTAREAFADYLSEAAGWKPVLP